MSGTTLANRSLDACSYLPGASSCRHVPAAGDMKVKPSNVAWIDLSMLQRQFPCLKEITSQNAKKQILLSI